MLFMSQNCTKQEIYCKFWLYFVLFPFQNTTVDFSGFGAETKSQNCFNSAFLISLNILYS